jgi:hypothetical protein
MVEPESLLGLCVCQKIKYNYTPNPIVLFLCGFLFLVSFTTMERESYGEDIADTETEKSVHSDEDAYDDSFIDDDNDPAVFSPSPISNEGKFKYLC